MSFSFRGSYVYGNRLLCYVKERFATAGALAVRGGVRSETGSASVLASATVGEVAPLGAMDDGRSGTAGVTEGEDVEEGVEAVLVNEPPGATAGEMGVLLGLEEAVRDGRVDHVAASLGALDGIADGEGREGHRSPPIASSSLFISCSTLLKLSTIWSRR
jgi:hypothetical protein